MRVGFFSSLVFHVAVTIVAYLGVPYLKPEPLISESAIFVDVVDVAENSNPLPPQPEPEAEEAKAPEPTPQEEPPPQAGERYQQQIQIRHEPAAWVVDCHREHAARGKTL